MKVKKRIGIVRGKFLNKYEMQTFEPLSQQYNITAFGSLTSFHSEFVFPTIKLFSPVDLPDFPKKMPVLNRIFTDAHYLYQLENHIKNYDLIHTAETYFHYTQQSLQAKKKGNVGKVIATVLDNIPFNNEGIYGRSAFKKRAREELDHIIALSEKTKQALILEGTDDKKISVIGYGIDTKKFTKIKTRYSLKKNIIILFVGRLEREKGIYEILYAAKRLVSDSNLKNFHLSFLLCGNGSQKKPLTALIHRLNLQKEISLTESSYENIHLLYQNADIFIAPSKESTFWQEQFNIALLEAQSSGLPIITTQSGSIPENVGDAAMLIQQGDFISLSDAIKIFILNPDLRIRYAKKARSRAEKKYDIQIVADKIHAVYEKVLNI